MKNYIEIWCHGDWKVPLRKDIYQCPTCFRMIQIFFDKKEKEWTCKRII